jgi:hypothetical protein
MRVVKRLAIVLVLASILIVGISAAAQAGLVGDTISGTLNWGHYSTNYFDPAQGYVPAGSSGIQPNAVVTDPDTTFVEFMFADGANAVNVDVDDLTIRVEVVPTQTWQIVSCYMHLTGFDSDISSLTLVSSTIPSMTWSVVDSGHGLQIDFPSQQIVPPGWVAVFRLSSTIAASAGPGGSISPTGSVPVDYEADQTFTITPDPGYHIQDVLVDGLSAGAVTSYTFNDVVAQHTISASFALNTLTFLAPLRPSDPRQFSNSFVKASPLSVAFVVDHTGQPAVTDLAATLDVLGPDNLVHYRGTFAYKASRDCYVCGIPRGHMAALPGGTNTIRVSVAGATYTVPIYMTTLGPMPR